MAEEILNKPRIHNGQLSIQSDFGWVQTLSMCPFPCQLKISFILNLTVALEGTVIVFGGGWMAWINIGKITIALEVIRGQRFSCCRGSASYKHQCVCGRSQLVKCSRSTKQTWKKLQYLSSVEWVTRRSIVSLEKVIFDVGKRDFVEIAAWVRHYMKG